MFVSRNPLPATVDAAVGPVSPFAQPLVLYVEDRWSRPALKCNFGDPEPRRFRVILLSQENSSAGKQSMFLGIFKCVT